MHRASFERPPCATSTPGTRPSTFSPGASSICRPTRGSVRGERGKPLAFFLLAFQGRIQTSSQHRSTSLIQLRHGNLMTTHRRLHTQLTDPKTRSYQRPSTLTSPRRALMKLVRVVFRLPLLVCVLLLGCT